ncbi:MAG: glycoside hydrolase family 16 protein [Verrucomicrobiales bacterium]
MSIRSLLILGASITGGFLHSARSEELPPLPEVAKLALSEDWSSGEIDPGRWYALRKRWGQGNSGVVPENISIAQDTVRGKQQNVLRCTANGDKYDGPVTGQKNNKARVGGVLVSKQHFASGRFEVVMKIGEPSQPNPAGMVAAIWTYGYRAVKVAPEKSDDFDPDTPTYHPYLQEWAKGNCFYWSEIDFPEYGKAGEYAKPMYNTFLNKQKHSTTFDVHGAADGDYHTYTTEWRTGLKPIADVKDNQVAEFEGLFFVQDKAIPYESYWGSPLKKIGPDQYAVYSGLSAKHWVDGKFVGENTSFVPAMGGQLNLGVWLPEWAGAADWETAPVSFASVKVWRYGDPGDVLGFLKDDIGNNFDKQGEPIH